MKLRIVIEISFEFPCIIISVIHPPSYFVEFWIETKYSAFILEPEYLTPTPAQPSTTSTNALVRLRSRYRFMVAPCKGSNESAPCSLALYRTPLRTSRLKLSRRAFFAPLLTKPSTFFWSTAPVSSQWSSLSVGRLHQSVDTKPRAFQGVSSGNQVASVRPAYPF